MNSWSRKGNLCFSCTALRQNTTTAELAILMTSHTETGYCYGLRSMTLTR